MPIRVPVQTIRVRRDNENVTPTIGKPFDFTAEELADINRVNPDAIRKPVVEDEPAVAPTSKAKKAEQDKKSDL